MKNPPVVEKITVRYGDLDPYGHVNNVVHLSMFESVRVAYMAALARSVGLVDTPSPGSTPGLRFLLAETNVRYLSPLFLGEDVYGAASVDYVSNRSFGMDYELRAGESYETGRRVSEGHAAMVLYDPDREEPERRPDWLLPAIAAFEDRPEEDFLRRS